MNDYIQIGDITGDKYLNKTVMYKNNFYTICRKNPKDSIGLRKKGMIIFHKKNVDLEFLYSDFARFCLSFFKNNQNNNGNMQMIPKIPIPISNELKDFIENFIPDWHNIRK